MIFDSLFPTTTHPKICKNNGFGGKEYALVRKWSKKADKYPCGSNEYYSAPFHARENALETGAKLYNLALKAKQSDRPLHFTFSGTDSKATISFLKYINKSDSAKTNKAQNDFLNLINSFNDPRQQADALLGLALHTIQDFFAHVVKVDLYCSVNNFYNRENYKLETEYKNINAFKTDELMGLKNNDIEDNIRVMSWRFRETCRITSAICEKWENDFLTLSITAKPTGDLKFYNRIKESFGNKKYWTIAYREYEWNIN